MKIKAVLIIVILSLIISGCTQINIKPKSTNEVQEIKSRCISLCQEYREEQLLRAIMEIDNGPCLSGNNPNWNISDWVCDIAHNPRQDIDNLPENQCQEYREGRAAHFIEVSPDCEFIKAV